jgi:hypothetical protein
VSLSRKSIQHLLELARAGSLVMAEDPVAQQLNLVSVERCRKALLPQEKKAKGGRSSRNKGRAGEQEARHYLVDQGFPEATRGLGQSRGGGKEAADCVNVGDLHVEVKRVEKLNIHKAYAQAVADADEGKTPIVLFRRNGGPWMVSLAGDDYFPDHRAARGIAEPEGFEE